VTIPPGTTPDGPAVPGADATGSSYPVVGRPGAGPAGTSVDLPEAAQPARPAQPAQRDEVADRVERAVLAVSSVTALHPGSYGEVATYLPGRRVVGVRTGDEGTSVHLAVAFGADLRAVAADVRRAVAEVAPGPVEVVVEDVTEP